MKKQLTKVLCVMLAAAFMVLAAPVAPGYDVGVEDSPAIIRPLEITPGSDVKG